MDRRLSPSALPIVLLLLALSAPAGAAAQPGPADSVYDVRTPTSPTSRPRASATVARDPLTGGVRVLTGGARFLTGPRPGAPARIALDYLRERPRVFGLDSGDLQALELTRSYRSPSGMTHLWWEQTYRGIPAFDQGLRANVTSDGRLINVGGAPRPDLSVPSLEPRVSPREALAAVARSVAAPVELGPSEPPRGAELATVFERGHRASLVLFGEPDRVRLAWRVLLRARSQEVYDAVVDASSGELLHRHNIVRHVTVLAHDNYPGAPSGGTATIREIPAAWLSAGATVLSGPYARVYSDPGNVYLVGSTPSTADEIPPSPAGAWHYSQTPTFAPGACPAAGCSWDNGVANSWTTNRAQAGTQLFYFVNRFHDHLRDAPGIGFDPASGNLEGGDRLTAQFDLGANVNSGLPDCAHTNNAGITVPPDGQPTLMLMLLWSATTPGCPEAGVYDVNGADDAYLVYHEYAHALSLRLVTDAAGNGALNGAQSGALGEGLSDWYAMDYLAAAGFQPDTPAPAEVRSGAYENVASRTQGFDCPVGEASGACPGTPTAGSGGYTYGDFGRILPDGAEIHADGEIWVQALWDLRSALIAAHGPAEGVTRARALVTDGLRLAPASPTFLDMRAAMLQADTARGYRDCDRIWAVFAARGMGVNARTSGDADTAPIEDFTVPPPACPLPPPVASDATAPVVRGFSMARARFRVGRQRTPRVAQRRRRRAPAGSAFHFRLSEPARVRIAIERVLPGRRVGRRCRPPSRRLRERRRCRRYDGLSSLTRRERRAGRNRVRFSGRIGARTLRRGRYRATIAAADAAGNRSKRRRTSFTILRR